MAHLTRIRTARWSFPQSVNQNWPTWLRANTEKKSATSRFITCDPATVADVVCIRCFLLFYHSSVNCSVLSHAFHMKFHHIFCSTNTHAVAHCYTVHTLLLASYASSIIVIIVGTASFLVVVVTFILNCEAKNVYLKMFNSRIASFLVHSHLFARLVYSQQKEETEKRTLTQQPLPLFEIVGNELATLTLTYTRITLTQLEWNSFFSLFRFAFDSQCVHGELCERVRV